MFTYLARLLLALLALVGHAAPTTPAPVHHAAPRTAPLTPVQARAVLAALVATHRGHVAQWGTYGYGATPGQYTALNAGVWAQLSPGQCVGYETYGAPGFFGTAYGFTGGDCS